MLDLETIRLFVLAVEFGGLTRAAEVAGTVQPAVSARIKALEGQLGRRLLDRTPRFVRLTGDGMAFLPHARSLLEAHDQALNFLRETTLHITIGASDHALGVGLEHVLRRLRVALPPTTSFDMQTGMSQGLLARFSAGEFDAVVIRRDTGGREGEVLGTDPLGWRASEELQLDRSAPVPLATLGAPCGVRAAAIRALDEVRRPWREVFVAGSCAALLAGVRAGLGVAPMGRTGSGGLADQGTSLGLPAMPDSEIVLFARSGTPGLALAMRVLAAGVRASLI